MPSNFKAFPIAKHQDVLLARRLERGRGQRASRVGSGLFPEPDGLPLTLHQVVLLKEEQTVRRESENVDAVYLSKSNAKRQRYVVARIQTGCEMAGFVGARCATNF
jgi:hypothetical protein